MFSLFVKSYVVLTIKGVIIFLLHIKRSSIVESSKIGTFVWNLVDNGTSEQKGSDFRPCLKSELFDNGMIMKSAEIGTFGFLTLTVLYSRVLKFGKRRNPDGKESGF